jgi:hypothetical protein
LLRLVDLAGVQVGQGQVAQRQGLELGLLVALAQVQGLAGRADALAEIAAFGQAHGLPAVAVAIEHDAVALEQGAAFSGPPGGGIGQALAVQGLERQVVGRVRLICLGFRLGPLGPGAGAQRQACQQGQLPGQLAPG